MLLGQVLMLVALAAAGAVCRFRSRLDHERALRPVAWLLELLLAGDLAGLVLRECVLAPARAAGLVPFTGLHRLAFHATQLAFLGWPFGIAALTWRLFVRGPGRKVVAALLPATMAVLALSYPTLRGAALANTYRGLLVAVLLITLGGLTLPRPDRFAAGRAHLVTLFLAAGLTAELAGPYLADPYRSWWTAQATWSLAFGAVLGAAVWRGRPWRTAPIS